MGIVDRTVKLYQLCQINAIDLKIEMLTVDLIKSVSKDLIFTNKIIGAIRTNNYEELAKYDDIYSKDINELLGNKFNSMNIEELKILKKSEERRKKKKGQNMILELIRFALEFDVAEKMAKEYVDYILISDNNSLKMSELKKLRSKYITGYLTIPKKKKTPKKSVP